MPRVYTDREVPTKRYIALLIYKLLPSVSHRVQCLRVTRGLASWKSNKSLVTHWLPLAGVVRGYSPVFPFRGP